MGYSCPPRSKIQPPSSKKSPPFPEGLFKEHGMEYYCLMMRSRYTPAVVVTSTR